MKERLRRLLIKQNPQWTGGEEKLPEFRRHLFSSIESNLKYRQIIAIVGLRRVGKTILIKQISRQLEVPPNNVCYISLDDIEFQNYEVVEELIHYFLEFSKDNEMRYLFIDEVQKLPHWADLLKTIYDTEQNLKMIISGSSNIELGEQKETLAGRLLTYYLPPFSFKEFLRYHEFETDIELENITREYDLRFAKIKEALIERFEQYVYKGAFPELLEIEDDDFIRKYIKESVIEKAIIDISRRTKQDERVIFELFKLLVNSNARLFEKKNLASILGINRNLVSEYIEKLEKTFLISISYNYSRSVSKQVRSSKKQYIAHSSIVMALMGYPKEILRTDLMGHMVESIVKNHIGETSFWRGPQKEEVDIVIQRPHEGPLPVEVKFRTQITNRDLQSLLRFLKKFDVDRGIVISKDILEERMVDDKKIEIIPAWLFLLAWNGDPGKSPLRSA